MGATALIVSRPGFRGCRYTAAELAIADPDHPAHAAVHEYKQRLHELFRAELGTLGHPDPEFAANQLLVLIDGVLVQAVTRPDARPALAAKALVECVLSGR